MAPTNKQKKHSHLLTQHNALQTERIRKLRLATNIISVSSNSKWLKIFETLAYSKNEEYKSTIKLLQQSQSWEYQSILSSIFEESYLDGMGGPIGYSEIEWIKFESLKFNPFNFQVDTEEHNGSNIIYGYRRTDS